MTHKLIKTDDYLLVVDDSEIKKGDYCTSDLNIIDIGKIHNSYTIFNPLTEDDLLKLKSCQKVIAHLPLNGSPILKGVDLLPPYSRHQEDGVDNAVMEFKERYVGVTDYELSAFSKGYNKAREKYKYTEEDVKRIVEISRETGLTIEKVMLFLPEYPTEFECEMKQRFEPDKDKRDNPANGVYYEPKTTTNAQGQRVWVGKYK